MTIDNTIKSIRTTFWLQTAIIIAAIILFETGIIAKNSIDLTPTMQYICEVGGIILTIALIPLAIKGFSAQMRRAAEQKVPHFNEYFRSKCNARLSIIFAVTITNILLYYGTGYNGALYCALFGIAATIYSYPTKETLSNYTLNEEDKK